MAVLVPQIESIVNGLITVSVLNPSIVEQTFDELHVFRSTSANGPFTSVSVITLTGGSVYTVLDTGCSPRYYYKSQFFNSLTLVQSQFSQLAQETGRYSEFSVPISSATYPPELGLSEEDLEIVESIRVAAGDLGAIERDLYDASRPQDSSGCSTQISPDRCTWELSQPKGWPQKVILNGENKVSLTDPEVLGYRYLVFSGTACITGTLDVFYNNFRFSDREILTAFDRAINFITATCKLTSTQITKEMRIMQAAILLLEGEVRDLNAGGADPLRVRDGDTEFDNRAWINLIAARTTDLEDLKMKMRELIKCAIWETSYSLIGCRVD